MKLEQHRPVDPIERVPFLPPSRIHAEHARDEVMSELRELWPNVVDLAKEPGLLYRLHAILNS
jgi:hypothetical protein